jgi:hypothetical protein
MRRDYEELPASFFASDADAVAHLDVDPHP